MDFTAHAAERGGARLNVIGNLPYHITSEIFFHLADHHAAIHTAVVTSQLEVAERYSAPCCVAVWLCGSVAHKHSD